MKNVKRTISLFLAFLLLFLFPGCGEGSVSSAQTQAWPEVIAEDSVLPAQTALSEEALTLAGGELSYASKKTSSDNKKEDQNAAEFLPSVKEGESYSSKEEVAAYLVKFGELPSNYLTKKEAQELGWVSSKGNLWEVAPGCSIGGDKFGNYEELLPVKKGRQYYECDIDYEGGRRNAKRIIFSSDGLIFYTEDHYESFTQLYPVPEDDEVSVKEEETYSSKEEVAAYLNAFGHLPSNYLTKKEAQELGWVSSKRNLWKVAPGMSIGGDKFGNYEGLLPEKKGRQYYECDIDYEGGTRNAKRIIFSNDGLIYYTEDHYESFELLYGDPGETKK